MLVGIGPDAFIPDKSLERTQRLASASRSCLVSSESKQLEPIGQIKETGFRHLQGRNTRWRAQAALQFIPWRRKAWVPDPVVETDVQAFFQRK